MQIAKEHWILGQLNHLIWKEKHWQMENYHYKHKGVPWKDFESYLHKKYIWEAEKNKLKSFWLFQIKLRFNENYISDFYAKIRSLVKDCMEKGYLEKYPLSGETELVFTREGKKLIEFFGFIEKFLQEFPQIINVFIGAGGILIINLILEKLLNIKFPI